jgi:cytochrome c-type biogenesis protein CcmH
VIRLALLLFVCLAFAARAAEESALEKRIMHIASELRCLVCQNQSLADSNADLAQDLRNTIREQLQAGKSEKDVVAFMVERYGDFVLYRPPLKASTVLLWFGPLLLVALGDGLLARRLLRRRAAEPELSEADRARAARLLGE